MDRASTNVVIGKNGDTQTVIVKNSKAGTLVIDKRDSLTGEPLEGVTFKVTTSTGSLYRMKMGRSAATACTSLTRTAKSPSMAWWGRWW